MTPIYGKLPQVAINITENGFLQGNMTTLLSERIGFSDKLHSFWRASCEAGRQGERTTQIRSSWDLLKSMI